MSILPLTTARLLDTPLASAQTSIPATAAAHDFERQSCQRLRADLDEPTTQMTPETLETLRQESQCDQLRAA